MDGARSKRAEVVYGLSYKTVDEANMLYAGVGAILLLANCTRFAIANTVPIMQLRNNRQLQYYLLRSTIGNSKTNTIYERKICPI